MDFEATLRAVGRQLDGSGCRWAAIGGVAVGVYGVPRATADIDLLVDGACAPRLEALLSELGYTLSFRWEESSHYTPTRPDRCPLDILHAHRAHSLGMLARAQRRPLAADAFTLPVVELEDLIGLKVQAMVNDPDRWRGELVDMRALLEAAAARHASVDLGRVREYFALFNEEHQLEELLEGIEDALR